jgi:hypothetical protein
VPPTLRAESPTEQVGDVLLNCGGGTPTQKGPAVPRVNVTVFLSANVTSRLLDKGLNEALLIVDEPNSTKHPNRPILACGDDGAPDTSVSNGSGIYRIPAMCVFRVEDR